MPLDRYVFTGGQKLRCGYTTGTCAALATKAATLMLLGGERASVVSLQTPDGEVVRVRVVDAELRGASASCAVKKDAGDDPDVTDGLLIYARVSRNDSDEILIDGGQGIGRVTRPGLDQPIGAAAINSVPRQMIKRAAREAMEALNTHSGLTIIISAPDGEAVGQRTFNRALGIKGGISILGTTGIVEPMSEQAYIDSIGITLNQLRDEGARKVLITPGSIGLTLVKNHVALGDWPNVKCSNFLGETIDRAARLGFHTLLVAGHIGKLIKVAAGVMQTHSKYADTRMEAYCAFAALAGAQPHTLRLILDAATTDAAMDILARAGLADRAIEQALVRADFHLSRRAGTAIRIGMAAFAANDRLLGVSPAARSIMGGV